MSLSNIAIELQDGSETGFRVLQELRTSHPGTAAIMLLHSTGREPVVDAFRSGARGVITRDKSFKALSKCIRFVYRGRIWASNEELEFILEAAVVSALAFPSRGENKRTFARPHDDSYSTHRPLLRNASEE